MRKHVISLMSGTAIAQAITLCIAPLLTRFYSPADFGLFGLFVACISIIGNTATLRYELAIVIPQKRDQAASVFVLCLPVTAVTALATLVLVLAIGRHSAALLGQPALAPLLWWLPVSVFSFGLFQALNYWATSQERFPEVATAQVMRAALAAIIQVACGVLLASGVGLVAGQVAAQVSVSAGWLWHTWRRDNHVIRPAFNIEGVKQAALRYRAFPKYGAPQATINSISQTLPFFLIGLFFPAAVLGFYVLAQRIVQAPVTLLASALSQVLLPRYARLQADGAGFARSMLRTSATLLVLASPAIPLLFLWGDEIFLWIFGKAWAMAGIFAGWLVVGMVVDLAMPPATSAVTALEMIRLQLGFEVAVLAARSTGILIGAWMQDAVVAIALFSLAGAVVNISFIMTAMLLVKRNGTQRGVCAE